MSMLRTQGGLSRIDHGSGRIRPAEGTHGPQAAGEPGVEDIRILLQAKRRQGRQQSGFCLRITQTYQDLHLFRTGTCCQVRGKATGVEELAGAIRPDETHAEVVTAEVSVK